MRTARAMSPPPIQNALRESVMWLPSFRLGRRSLGRVLPGTCKSCLKIREPFLGPGGDPNARALVMPPGPYCTYGLELDSK
jgi:hypothetical protein